jgi:hypothetical protein
MGDNKISPKELHDAIKKKPFTPIRLHMRDGRTHDVRHAEDAIVGDEVIALGVCDDGAKWPRISLLSIISIKEVEPLAQSH